MVAYHFPPCRGSSGLQRTVNFCRHLPRHGWQPIVLSAHPRTYPQVSNDLLPLIADISVKRAFALDTAKHLSFRGAYLGWLALPDRWVSWLLGGIPAGLKLIREHRPQVIWSTYPIATAHLIGLALHRITGIPWVADFRDPMVEVDPRTDAVYPPDASLRNARLWVEAACARRAAKVVFCTPGARKICVERYPWAPESRWTIIANGYDEESFAAVERINPGRHSIDGPIVLLHSGILYASQDRDPTAFFDALATLVRQGKITVNSLRIRLRASGYEDHYSRLLQERGLQKIVSLDSAIPYHEALAEMLNVNGLLVFQGYPSNPAIPAKLYEYVRARRPIFAMTDAKGDTAALLRELNVGRIVPLDSVEEIANGLLAFLNDIRTNNFSLASDEQIKALSREPRGAEFATLLDAVAGCATLRNN